MTAKTDQPSVNTRRSFLRRGAAAAGGIAAFAASISPLLDADPESFDDFDDFLQKHYKEMTDADLEVALERIAQKVQRRFGVSANVSAPPPLDGVEFVYALNLSRCNGNRKCVHACVAENNQSRAPELQYIRVLAMPKGTIDLERAVHDYDPDQVPDEDQFYMPVQCHQCARPPCVKVCPVEATWQEPDGITVIDYDWCIGCRYCQAACPYWARRFNFSRPEIPAERLNTYCLHRTRAGRQPACLEACPTGARKFGNVLDPDSEVSRILRTKRIFVLKEEAGTLPRFFYYYDERRPRSRRDMESFERADEHGETGVSS
jgi:molybdopterin-containing oxidoreductase family iron-sulfur binding subunit